MANFSQVRQPLSKWHQFLQRVDAVPTHDPEDSIALRALVQALVIVGIIATDIAAADGTNWMTTSYWAIPLSIAGAVWSWYRRRDRNIATKFGLALAMLLVLAGFFLRLLAELNDTRLALAQLLIQLQVLHSFDLPRRRDLGYSMVIGLILLGVAGTLSQTLAFAPVLLIFMAIALPTLVLDYRSQLGLVPRTRKPQKKIQLAADLTPKRLGIIFLIILSLGLAIFASLPRLPSYQLRTFPVSSPIEFEGEFDGRSIVNPGYVREGRESGEGFGTGTSQGQGQGRGQGTLDDTFYYGFSTQINQNLRGGAMKPQVVLRIRSQAEGFWRVLAFDRYTGQGWEVSRNEQTQIINRPRWTYQFLLPRLPSLSNKKEVVQTYTVVSELPNVIPALPFAKELYYPTRQVAIDSEGSLRSPLGLVEGLTYTVISEVPYRDRTQLGQASTQYPKAVQEHYLQLPPEIVPRIRQHTEDILAKSPSPITAPYEKALYLAQYLKQQYTIQPNLEFLSENEDLVEAFLFKYEGGYPDHFSSVLTVMLRSIGIPARLATGFAPGEFNPFTGLYLVRNTDAYAVTEVYFPRYGWFAFDPIPGHELIPPSIEEDQTFTVLKRFWQWVAGWLPSPLTGWLNWLFGTIMAQIAGIIGFLLRLFTRGWIGLFTGLGLLIGLSFFSWLSWNAWQTWRYHRWLSRLSPMEGLYQQMLTWLTQQGFPKRSAQTPLEYAQQLHTQYEASYAESIDAISDAYVQWRYGGKPVNIQQLEQKLKVLKQQRSLKQPWVRVRSTLPKNPTQWR